MKKLYSFWGVITLLFISQLALAEQQITLYYNDVLGSPVAATDISGNVLWKEDYEPYGKQRLSEQYQNHRGYTGHVKDDTSGLVYMGARYYDPQIGRFYGVDPVGFTESNPQSFNRYAYANNNPYKYVDPDGRTPDPITLGYFVHDVGKLLVQEIVYTAAVVTGNDGVAVLAMQGVIDARADAMMSTVDIVNPVSLLSKVKRVADVAKNVDLASPQRRRHILDGDATGGGHRPGTGKPGKSEFPQGWSDDKIMHEISDVATDPNAVTRAGRGGRTITEGTRDGIDIRVIQERNGDIVSGFPTNVPRNP